MPDELKFTMSEEVKEYCRKDVLDTEAAFQSLYRQSILDLTIANKVRNAINKIIKDATIIDLDAIFAIDHDSALFLVYKNSELFYGLKGGSAVALNRRIVGISAPINYLPQSMLYHITVRYSWPYIFDIAITFDKNGDISQCRIVDSDEDKHSLFKMLTGKTIQEYVSMEEKHGQ